MPETAAYRKYTEQVVRERAAVLTQVYGFIIYVY